MISLDEIFKECLSSAERRFGSRDRTWRIGPVQADRTNFPQTIVFEDSRQVVVHTTMTTAGDTMQARYQLAHEAVHCLSPVGRMDTIWFEEGLAVHHSLTIEGLSRKYRRAATRMLPRILEEPYEAFLALGLQDPQIVALREQEPTLDRVNAFLLVDLFKIPQPLALRVSNRLPYDRPDKM